MKSLILIISKWKFIIFIFLFKIKGKTNQRSVTTFSNHFCSVNRWKVILLMIIQRKLNTIFKSINLTIPQIVWVPQCLLTSDDTAIIFILKNPTILSVALQIPTSKIHFMPSCNYWSTNNPVPTKIHMKYNLHTKSNMIP